MPHYKDGTEAKVGDLVKGTGYNLKDTDKNPLVFIGKVVGITPGSASCNIQVAHINATEISSAELAAVQKLYLAFHPNGVIGCGPDGGKDGTPKIVATVSLEYGQCDAFEKIG